MSDNEKPASFSNYIRAVANLERSRATPVSGARDVFSKAYQLSYISEEDGWLLMIADRNQTAHVYDEAQARVIVARVADNHLRLSQTLRDLVTAW